MTVRPGQRLIDRHPEIHTAQVESLRQFPDHFLPDDHRRLQPGLERRPVHAHLGLEASKFAFVNGIVLLAVGPATVNLSGWLCDRWYARGVTDAALRIAVIGAFIMVITGVIAPLMPTGDTAMLMFGVHAVGLAMITATGVTALLNMTPGEIRAQVVAFYYMAISLTGLLLGPTTIGILNDQVFGELGLKYSMALLPFVYGLPVLLLVPVTLRLYAGACAGMLRTGD